MVFRNVFVPNSSNNFLSRQDFLIWGTGFWTRLCSFRIQVKRDLFFGLWLLSNLKTSTRHNCFHLSIIPPPFLEPEEEEPFFPLEMRILLYIANLRSISNNVIPVSLPTLVFIHLELFKSGHLALRLAVRKCHRNTHWMLYCLKEQDIPTV